MLIWTGMLTPTEIDPFAIGGPDDLTRRHAKPPRVLRHEINGELERRVSVSLSEARLLEKLCLGRGTQRTEQRERLDEHFERVAGACPEPDWHMPAQGIEKTGVPRT